MAGHGFGGLGAWGRGGSTIPSSSGTQPVSVSAANPSARLVFMLSRAIPGFQGDLKFAAEASAVAVACDEVRRIPDILRGHVRILAPLS